MHPQRMHFRIDLRMHLGAGPDVELAHRMEKRSHGQIRTHDRKDGLTTYSLRVRAYGRREVVTLGADADGWTMRKAERKLEQVLAEIQVGVWRPPSMTAGGEDPTFHEFA